MTAGVDVLAEVAAMLEGVEADDPAFRWCRGLFRQHGRHQRGLLGLGILPDFSGFRLRYGNGFSFRLWLSNSYGIFLKHGI